MFIAFYGQTSYTIVVNIFENEFQLRKLSVIGTFPYDIQS